MNKDYQIVEKAIKYLEDNFKNQPELKEIAGHVGLSEFYFQKVFKKWAGISPKKFLQVLTLEYTKKKLEESDLLDVTYEAGLSSTSRLHELFVNIEAVTPSEWKSYGKNLEIFYEYFDTPFGDSLVAVTNKGICYFNFIVTTCENELSRIQKRWKNARFIKDKTKTSPYIKKMFSGNGKVDVILVGTNFQIQVWRALLKIPQGELTTYQEVAKKVKNPKAVRAVGSAIGDNPICYLIPCHRVINSSGVIGNYGGGRFRKKMILGLELGKK